MPAPTIEEMLEQTANGEKRLFKAPIRGAEEDRFYRAAFSDEYRDPVRWDYELDYDKIPLIGTRHYPDGSLDMLPEPEMTAKTTGARIPDFLYASSFHMFLISKKLKAVFDELDPGSLQCRPVTIHAKDGPIEFYLVKPKRNISAIDTERTDIEIRSEHVGKWIKYISFPEYVVFDKELLADIHNFSDIDMPGWFWSQELIDAAQAAGVKGVRLKLAGGAVMQNYAWL